MSPQSCYRDTPIPFQAVLISKLCLQRHFNTYFDVVIKMAAVAQNTSLLFLQGCNCQLSELVKIPNVIFGVESSPTYQEPVPGIKCAGESSKPSVRPHRGSSSERNAIPLWIRLGTTTSPAHTMPTRGWEVAFGGPCGFRLDVSQPFRGESDLASDRTPHPPPPAIPFPEREKGLPVLATFLSAAFIFHLSLSVDVWKT